jgi:peptidoglycan hydrolase-like protein with peptidoglycan-binding domain
MAFPLIAIAASLLPELLRLIAGDRAGTAATQVAEAVKTITGTDDPAAAQAALLADPAKASELRIKLAEIALEQQRIQRDAEEKQRQAELDELKARTADVGDARSKTLELAKQGSSIAWGAPVVSITITVGFFAVLLLMVFKPFDENATLTIQLLNVVIGALVASFTAVVNYWLGSSQGSRDKDATVRSLQAAQATTNSQALREVREIAQAAASRPAEAVAPLAIAALPTAAPAGENFAACLEIVLQQEGGFSDNPADPGGATKFGITLKTLADFREKPVTKEDVQALTKDEAREIYRANYWNTMSCNQLPRGIDLIAFDFGVNAGPRTAIKALQRAAGVTDDGSIGPVTLAAIRAHQPANLVNRMAAERMKHYRSLTTFDTFGTGWSNRNEAVKQAATRMVIEGGK